VTTPRIAASIVGAEVGPLSQEIDARWLMAYAAGLGLTEAAYYETRGPDGPLAHPMFPVCYEWPLALEIRARTIPHEIATLGVHATHRALIDRLPRAGDRLSTSARVVGVTRRRAGTLVTTRFTTIDERGAPVTTTDYGSVYRGVDCDGEATIEPHDVGARPRWTERVDVPAWAAHVYTECARIWNPIHTDVAVATAAGLPAITGMVLLPSTLTVHGLERSDGRVGFEAVDAAGHRVLSDAAVLSYAVLQSARE